MTDDNDDERRHETYAEKIFGTPEEQAAMQREIAERRAQIERDETLAWCVQRAASRDEKGTSNVDSPSGPTDELRRPLNEPRYRLNPDVVTRSYSAPVPQPRAASASLTRRWRDYIERKIARELRGSNMAMTKAIAQVVVAEERARAKADDEIMAKLDAITAQLAELQERLEKLEAAPANKTLKLVRPDDPYEPGALIG